MSSAVILGQISVPKIKGLRRIKEFAMPLDGYVAIYGPHRAAFDILVPFSADAYGCYLYATMWVGPHTDDDIVGDITVGVIIEGDHCLFTGNGRQIGNLAPGTVFALLNKKLHGAYARDMENPTPLIFAACEPKVPVENWRDFCVEAAKKLHIGSRGNRYDNNIH